MPYAKLNRPSRQRQLKLEEVRTMAGHIYFTLRWLGLRRLARALLRPRWHVADIYVGGRFYKARYAVNNARMARALERRKAKVERLARKQLQRSEQT